MIKLDQNNMFIYTCITYIAFMLTRTINPFFHECFGFVSHLSEVIIMYELDRCDILFLAWMVYIEYMAVICIRQPSNPIYGEFMFFASGCLLLATIGVGATPRC